MAVSGTSTFLVNRNEVINATLRLLQVIGTGQTPDTEDITNCSQALNIMIKSWAKKGMPLWVTEQVAIPMVADINPYPLGPEAGYIGAVVINDGGTGYPDTGTVTFTGGTTGTSATGTYTAEDGVIQSVTMVTGGDTYLTVPTVTFSGAGTGADGTAQIVGLTMSRPLRVFNAFLRSASGNDTPLIPISRQEYDILGNKSSIGVVNQFYYDTQIPIGYLYVYNVPQDSTYTFYAQIQRQFYDMTTSTDDFDFPQEWFQALKWGLACEVLAEYGVSLEMIPYYEQKAQMYIDECFNWSVEDTSVFFTMNPEGTVMRATY